MPKSSQLDSAVDKPIWNPACHEARQKSPSPKNAYHAEHKHVVKLLDTGQALDRRFNPLPTKVALTAKDSTPTQLQFPNWESLLLNAGQTSNPAPIKESRKESLAMDTPPRARNKKTNTRGDVKGNQPTQSFPKKESHTFGPAELIDIDELQRLTLSVMDDDEARDLSDDVEILLTHNQVDCHRILEKIGEKSSQKVTENGREDGEIDDKENVNLTSMNETPSMAARKVIISGGTMDAPYIVTSIDSDDEDDGCSRTQSTAASTPASAVNTAKKSPVQTLAREVTTVKTDNDAVAKATLQSTNSEEKTSLSCEKEENANSGCTTDTIPSTTDVSASRDPARADQAHSSCTEENLLHQSKLIKVSVLHQTISNTSEKTTSKSESSDASVNSSSSSSPNKSQFRQVKKQRVFVTTRSDPVVIETTEILGLIRKEECSTESEPVTTTYNQPSSSHSPPFTNRNCCESTVPCRCLPDRQFKTIHDGLGTEDGYPNCYSCKCFLREEAVQGCSHHPAGHNRLSDELPRPCRLCGRSGSTRRPAQNTCHCGACWSTTAAVFNTGFINDIAKRKRKLEFTQDTCSRCGGELQDRLPKAFEAQQFCDDCGSQDAAIPHASTCMNHDVSDCKGRGWSIQTLEEDIIAARLWLRLMHKRRGTLEGMCAKCCLLQHLDRL